nr:CMESO_55 [Cryptomonas curvata]
MIIIIGMLQINNLYFQFRYCKNLVKKTQKSKLKAISKNNENSQKIDETNFNENNTDKTNEKLNTYLKNLPQSLLKSEKKINFFSHFWLQKIGRTDLSYLTKENNFRFFIKNEKIDSKTVQQTYTKKKASSVFYKNKSKISLGPMVEEKMLNYSEKKAININRIGDSTENKNINTLRKKSIKNEKIDYVQINIIEFYEFKKNIKFILYIFFYVFILSAVIF